MGGQAQPNSGATPWAKEDIKTELFLVQHKEVQEGTKSHTLKMDELKKLRHHAIDDGRRPLYMIDVLDHKRSYYLICQEDYEALVEALYELVYATEDVRG